MKIVWGKTEVNLSEETLGYSFKKGESQWNWRKE